MPVFRTSEARRSSERDGPRKGALARTSSSLSFLHSSQPSHFLFMRLTATRCIFAYSGRAPTTDCIFDTGLLGGSAPCQSQSQTVPKEPSPKALMGVKERTEAVRKKIKSEREKVRKRD